MTDSTVLCSTCNAHFDNNADRRQHMSEDWHVCNMKRRIVELSPISSDQYLNLMQTALPTPTSNNEPSAQVDVTGHCPSSSQDQNSCDDSVTAASDASRCLFCLVTLASTDGNIQHMAIAHGCHLPDTSQLQTDVETLLAYIGLVIGQFHVCLYCNQERLSAEAVRAHMLSKGHCMLDMSPESDFLDFWSSEEGGTTAFTGAPSARNMLSETELRLASGSVATSRQHEQPSAFSQYKRTSKQVALASSQSHAFSDNHEATPSASSTPTRSLALRDQMGIVGLLDQQKRGLAMVQRKMFAREQRPRNEARWVLEKFGNKTKQKHFKVSRFGIYSAMQVCWWPT